MDVSLLPGEKYIGVYQSIPRCLFRHQYAKVVRELHYQRKEG